MAEIIKLDGTQQLDFDRATVEQAYDRWAPIYDLVFGGVFSKGRRAAIAAALSLLHSPHTVIWKERTVCSDVCR